VTGRKDNVVSLNQTFAIFTVYMRVTRD